MSDLKPLAIAAAIRSAAGAFGLDRPERGQ